MDEQANALFQEFLKTEEGAKIASLRRLFDVFCELTAQVDLERSVALLSEAKPRFLAVIAGETPQHPSIQLLAALVICQQHIAWGCPLHLSNELFDQWADSADGCAECVDCGYRHPKGYAACVLCNGVTGFPGVFLAKRERRAEVAGWN